VTGWWTASWGKNWTWRHNNLQSPCEETNLYSRIKFGRPFLVLAFVSRRKLRSQKSKCKYLSTEFFLNLSGDYLNPVYWTVVMKLYLAGEVNCWPANLSAWTIVLFEFWQLKLGTCQSK
jgi:hypothetical protein